jgi:hypothetical protein
MNVAYRKTTFPSNKFSFVGKVILNVLVVPILCNTQYRHAMYLELMRSVRSCGETACTRFASPHPLHDIGIITQQSASHTELLQDRVTTETSIANVPHIDISPIITLFPAASDVTSNLTLLASSPDT